MLKTVQSLVLLVLSLLLRISAADNEFSRCNCDDDGSLWSIENILMCQRASDFLIAVAYFSIPIELLYFVSCSNVPFKWVLSQFIAFIVLCGLTHLLNGWTYGPHSFQLMLALTVFKILTALVSCATAITLITLIPLLLKVKVREFMLKKKAWDLGREVGIIMKQREAGLHVRMLTQEIRKSLDRHTILYTTLVELSKTLGLQNCAVWMPNEGKTEMNLTHELRGRNYTNSSNFSIQMDDPDVERINGVDGVEILAPDSSLAVASCGESGEAGPVAAIRMPMLRVSNFKGGTPELIPTCYAILVLVLPGGQGEPQRWTNQELHIIKGVADQVAVALSHAAVLEESQLMREKLEEQNRTLQQARRNAMMASQARNSFQKVMSDGMRRPMHTISGLLSIMQDEQLSDAQKIIVKAMAATGDVFTTLMNDAMEISPKSSGRFHLEIRPLELHFMIKEAACLLKCLCNCSGYGFAVEVERSLPNHVMGDERRVFQAILHLVGNLLKGSKRGKMVTLRVFSVSRSQGWNDQRWANWRPSSSSGDVYIKFEFGIDNYEPGAAGSVSIVQLGGGEYNTEEGLSFSICKRLVQQMQGVIFVGPSPEGLAQSMALVLRFQLRQSVSVDIISEFEGPSSDRSHSSTLLRGTKILLADGDDMNRVVTRKLLEKLGCIISTTSAGFECLNAISSSTGSASSLFQIIMIDLQLPEVDGFEVTSWIRKSWSHSSPLIIGMTASGDRGLWERCMEVGMKGFLRKPATLRGMAEELKRVILLPRE